MFVFVFTITNQHIVRLPPRRSSFATFCCKLTLKHTHTELLAPGTILIDACTAVSKQFVPLLPTEWEGESLPSLFYPEHPLFLLPLPLFSPITNPHLLLCVLFHSFLLIISFYSCAFFMLAEAHPPSNFLLLTA